MERTQVKRDLAILLIISAFILLWNLGTGSLNSWDEALYAEVSREILETGNWIDLSWGGAQWSDKPPLYMWVTALFYRSLGINEFSVRLFSSLCGIGVVLLTYLLALKLLYPRQAAFSSSLILLTTWHFILYSKNGTLDIALTFFMLSSIYLFMLGENSMLKAVGKKRAINVCLFLSPIAFALAFLTKGMGAILIPMILFLYLLFKKELKIILNPSLIAGMIVSLTILIWWHWLAISHYGEDFVGGYFIKHIFTRTTKAVEGHTGDFFTYFGVIPNKGRPWAGLGLVVLPYLLWRLVKYKENKHLLVLIWAGTVLLLFSVVKTKLHWYVIPLYPALSISSGWVIDKVFKKYTTAMICTLAFCSLIYLSADKGIFDLDYSPKIKKISIEVKNLLPEDKNLYLYDISDPGMQFYFGDIGKNIHSKEDVDMLTKNKDVFIVIKKEDLKRLPQIRYADLYSDDTFIFIKTK